MLLVTEMRNICKGLCYFVCFFHSELHLEEVFYVFAPFAFIIMLLVT